MHIYTYAHLSISAHTQAHQKTLQVYEQLSLVRKQDVEDAEHKLPLCPTYYHLALIREAQGRNEEVRGFVTEYMCLVCVLCY